MTYKGRFAPSPSGPLHFGSLVAALGSYFQAKSQLGQWLVRIEDLDPPREMPGCAKLILKTLEEYHLEWDGDILYQSQRHDIYQERIDSWLNSGQAYYCQCTRKQIKAQGGFYKGICRDKKLTNSQGCAVRLHTPEPVYQFNDIKHGELTINPALAKEDFIIKRRDGLFAYNLAVVLDDLEQGITEVVRGADLIEPTGRQISLYKLLKKTPVSYLHLPLALGNDGQKLSKQNHAKGIQNDNKKVLLIDAMKFLGFHIEPDMYNARMDEIISWGVKNWSISMLPKSTGSIPLFSNRSL